MREEAQNIKIELFLTGHAESYLPLDTQVVKVTRNAFLSVGSFTSDHPRKP